MSSDTEPTDGAANRVAITPTGELLAQADTVLNAHNDEALETGDLERLVELSRAIAEAPPSLVSRLAEAMAEAGRVVKDGRNTEQNYAYASVEAVLEEVRRPLLERSIILLTVVTGADEQPIRSRSGTEGTALTLTVDFTFYDGLTDAILTVPGWRGQGQDYGDKVYGKAYTNAIKTFVRTTWLLPTGDDPEADNPERIPKGAPPELPAWATPATSARKAELGAAIIPLLGRETARGIIASVQGTLGHTPDVLVGYTKLLVDAIAEADPGEAVKAIGARRAELEAERVAKAEAATAAADKAAQDAAEAPDPEAGSDRDPTDDEDQDVDVDPETGESPEDPKSYADVEDVDGPPPGEENTGPAPGTLELPEEFAGANEAAKTRMLATAGCICPDPLSDPEGLEEQREAYDDACPVKGHGIPF
jgi:hypothetical protein